MWKVCDNLETIMQQSHNNLSRCVGSPANGYWPYDYVININWKPKIYNLHTYNYFINLVFYICKIVNNPAKYQTIFLDPYFITVPKFQVPKKFAQNSPIQFLLSLCFCMFVQVHLRHIIWFFIIDILCEIVPNKFFST